MPCVIVIGSEHKDFHVEKTSFHLEKEGGKEADPKEDGEMTWKRKVGKIGLV